MPVKYRIIGNIIDVMGARGMHELGVLMEIMRIVDQTARENRIRSVKAVTLSVGEESGYLPVFLHRLFPVAAEYAPVMKAARLYIDTCPGRGIQVKSIEY